MRGSVYKLFVQPVLNPRGGFVVIIHGTLPLFKQGVVHFAFGCRYKHIGPYEIRTIALEALAVGNSIKNVVLAVVLSAPKSNTATDLLPCVLL
jgi:hypothetical protein